MNPTVVYLNNINIWHKYPELPSTQILGCPSKLLWATTNPYQQNIQATDNSKILWTFDQIQPWFPNTINNPETMLYILLAHEDNTALLLNTETIKHISAHEIPLNSVQKYTKWNKEHVCNAVIQSIRNIIPTHTQCAIFASTLMANLVSKTPATTFVDSDDTNAIRILKLADTIWEKSHHTQELMTLLTQTFPKQKIKDALNANLAVSIPIPIGTTIPNMTQQQITLDQPHAATLIPIEDNIYYIDNDGVCILDMVQIDNLFDNISKQPRMTMGYLIQAVTMPML